MRLGTVVALAVASALFSFTPAVADPPTVGADSNLPVPRFVSLRVTRANGRVGPSVDHRIIWVYQRPGLPLMVTGESGPWRRVRDPAGARVWIHEQNLEERRTIYVQDPTTLRRTPSGVGRVVAYLGGGVVGAVTACAGEWRRVAVRGRVGWVDNAALWGGDCAGLATSDEVQETRDEWGE